MSCEGAELTEVHFVGEAPLAERGIHAHVAALCPTKPNLGSYNESIEESSRYFAAILRVSRVLAILEVSVAVNLLEFTSSRSFRSN